MPPRGNQFQISFRTGTVHVFFADPEPLVLIPDRLMADLADALDHAPASLKFTVNHYRTAGSATSTFGAAHFSSFSYPEQDKTSSLHFLRSNSPTRPPTPDPPPSRESGGGTHCAEIQKRKPATKGRLLIFNPASGHRNQTSAAKPFNSSVQRQQDQKKNPRAGAPGSSRNACLP